MEKYKVCKYIKTSTKAERKATRDVKTHQALLIKALHSNVIYNIGKLHREYIEEQIGTELEKLL